jgi:hypothetical protein
MLSKKPTELFNMDSIAAIFKNLKTRDREARLVFYDRLGFNLTIAIRSIWSSSDLPDKQKVEMIKIVNEVSHLTFNWTWRLKKDDGTFDDLDCLSDIKNYANKDERVAGKIGQAIKASYLYLEK